MIDRLQIAVADDHVEMRQFFQKTLNGFGHKVVALVDNGRALVDACQANRPDLIITDIVMPDMDGLDAAQEISRDQPVPVVVVSAYHDPDFLRRAGQRHILAYLVKPITEKDLAAAISIAIHRFEEFRALRKEADDLRQALEDRKVIERAKGLIMKQTGLDEPAAFKRLQKLARDNNRKLVDVARNVITTIAALEPKAE